MKTIDLSFVNGLPGSNRDFAKLHDVASVLLIRSRGLKLGSKVTRECQAFYRIFRKMLAIESEGKRFTHF